MYEDEDLINEEIGYGLNFTKMQVELKAKLLTLKLLIEGNKKREVNKLLIEIDNILEGYY